MLGFSNTLRAPHPTKEPSMVVNARNSPLFAIGKAKWDAFVATYKGPYSLEGAVYAGMNRKLSFVCSTHGAQTMDAKNMMLGRKCYPCALAARVGNTRVSISKVLTRFREAHGDTYDYSNVVYNGAQKPVVIVCKKHGNFLQKPEYHWGGSGCPKCFTEDRRGASQKDTIDTLREKVHAALGGKITLIGDTYNGSQSAISCTCVEHGGVFTSMPYRLIAGNNPCSKCGHMKSNMEMELADYLSTLTTIVPRDRTILAPKEIDIYLPEHKIGVEFHGLYWHTTTRIGMTHRKKWELSKEKGIRLIQVFEDEWIEKQDIVKARLAALVGIGPKYDARKCTLKICTPQESREFLTKTHIQGPGVYSVAYGLYLESTLIAVASFGKSRSGAMTGAMDPGVWEVIRYASTGRVRGGFSRLLAAFKAESNPTKIISYCDLRYGDGKLYASTGFSLDSITEPDYWWVPRGRIQRISRYTTQKHKLAAHPILKEFYTPEKTENQVCADAGWEKIHGVGHQKWLWKA